MNPDHARFADVNGTLPTTDCAICGVSSQLTDSDPRAGHIAGKIVFGPAIYSTSNTTGVTEYRLYFVDAAGERLGSQVAVVPEAPSALLPSECCLASLHTVHVQARLPELPRGQDALRLAIIPVVGDLELPRGSATSPVQDLIGDMRLEAYTTTTVMTTRPPLVAFAGVLVVKTASVQSLMTDSAARAAIGRSLSRASGVISAWVEFSSFTGQPEADLASFSYRLFVKEEDEVVTAASTLRDRSAIELQAFMVNELEAIGKESYDVGVISNTEATTTTTVTAMPPEFPLTQADEQGALANVGIIVVACLALIGCGCVLFIACVLQHALHHRAKAASMKNKVLPIQPIDVVGSPTNSPGNHNGELNLKTIWPQPPGQLPEEIPKPPTGPACVAKLAPAARQDEHKESSGTSKHEVNLQRPITPPVCASPPTWAPVGLVGGSGDQASFAEDDWPDSSGAGCNLFGVVPCASTMYGGSSTSRLRSIRTSQRSESPEDASILSCTGSSLGSLPFGLGGGHQSLRQSQQPRGTYDIHELAELKQLPGSMNTVDGGWRCPERKLHLKRPASAARNSGRPSTVVEGCDDWNVEHA